MVDGRERRWVGIISGVEYERGGHERSDLNVQQMG